MIDQSIVPALLSNRISDYIHQAEEYASFSQLIHIDIMDGIYVIEKSPTFEMIIDQIKDISVEYSIHLMHAQPLTLLDVLAQFPAISLVYLHIELVDASIFTKKYPFKIALVVNPNTDIALYQELLMQAEVIQIMTVYPGRQGSPFIAESLNHITNIRDMGFKGKIHVDGHINEETIPIIASYGVDLLNVGSAFSQSNSRYYTYQTLTQLFKQYQKPRDI